MQACVRYPDCSLIRRMFYFQFCEQEPTEADLARLQERLQQQYAGEPFAEYIVTWPAPAVIVESYYMALPGAVDGTTVSSPPTHVENWRDYVYEPGQY